jgi:putative redox protein
VYGGGDAGPNPYELLLAALGSCMSMTVLLYARRKKWPLERVVVRLSHEREHAKDCEQPKDLHGRIERITSALTLVGERLTDEQRTRLKEIAGHCPVHETLSGGLELRTELA